jgi:hypothetical protein
MIPRPAGGDREDGTILNYGFSGHTVRRSVRPDPPGLIRSRWIRFLVLSSDDQAVFILAPSITTPLVTYFHKATSSFRARATIVTFLARGPSRRTLSWNQRASADPGWCRSQSQAISTAIARRRGLPAFETPCSWLIVPLFQGVGASPA